MFTHYDRAHVAQLCEKAGLQILAMKRIRLGRVTLADLPVGQWRYLAGWAGASRVD